jgi:hypothetical protein
MNLKSIEKGIFVEEDINEKTTVVDLPIIQGVSSVTNFNEATFGFKSSSLLVDTDIASFEVKIADYETNINAINNQATFKHTFTGLALGAVATIKVIAIDSLGNKSLETTHEVTIVDNQAPTVPTVTIENSVLQTKDLTFTISGSTDENNDDITYKIVDTGEFTFDKTVNIAENEAITLTAPSVDEDTSLSFSVVAVDSNGLGSDTIDIDILVHSVTIVGTLFNSYTVYVEALNAIPYILIDNEKYYLLTKSTGQKSSNSSYASENQLLSALITDEALLGDSLTDTNVHLYNTWSTVRNINKVLLLNNTGSHAVFNLVGTITDTISGRLTHLRNQYTRSTSASINYISDVYAGTLNTSESTAVPSDQFGSINYFHLYGQNTSSDTDESVLAFTSQLCNSNSWDDSWRGDGQCGTYWSLWNDDYGPSRNRNGMKWGGSSHGQGHIGIPASISNTDTVCILVKGEI